MGIMNRGIDSHALSRGDLLRFIPITVTVQNGYTDVDGCFVNLNHNCDIANLREIDMEIYRDENLLVSGKFDMIIPFSIKAMQTSEQSFRFKGKCALRSGVHKCTDRYYAVFSCRFSV